MSSTDERQLVARKDVARIYGIPPRFLEVAAMRGDGPRFIKIGRLCYYRVSEIEHWLDAQTVTPGADQLGRED
ncbi:helix-turn-helix domain-containing protein [Limibaculum sp. M0105]|uniref:Helix-turn-helix domain-containing protein n=1 Tax=Thermohalobaculum xanthum TaxID=2753746 RepID=A0A8J7M632_9RHOB|nr:helix-turn-helix domain-containing protein [Thermohalobaculum xanthum]MBK0399014.1 helix-turn-helix domain-containing protein [Thermohalobaculum xanthum]